MFPWSPDKLLQSHVESVPSELARITGLDYRTARKLSKGEPISDKKLDQCPFPSEIKRFYADDSVKVRVCEEWEAVLGQWQKVFVQSGAEAAASFAKLKTTMSSILWVEKFFRDKIYANVGDPPRIFQGLLSDDSPLAPFPEVVSKIIGGPNSDEQKMRACCEIYEIKAFPLYYAAMDHDFDVTRLIEDYPSPRRFLPTFMGKSLRRPIWHYFDWLRETCDCKNWSELVRKADPKEQDHSLSDKVKNWRNSKTPKTLPRRESVLTLISSLFRNDAELREDFSDIAITVYGLARIMQIHLMECTSKARIIRLDETRIPESYAGNFERWEKTGCRKVPLHPMFDNMRSD